MKNTRRTVVSAGLVLALVAGAGGIAFAAVADPRDWYSGSNAVADPDNVTSLKIVGADGTQITSGSINSALGAFAVADGTVRTGDTSAALFAHLATPGTAPGAWGGHQLSGTTKFSGGDAVTPPSGASGKPFVSLADALPLAETVGAYPNTASASSFAGVYELRLRTGSATKGVSNSYGSAYVKVTGSTWTTTTAPDLGQVQGPVATVKPTWGSNFAYGSARSIPVAVTGGGSTAKGNVKLLSGSTTLAAAKTLDASGKATLTIAKGALKPGVRKVKVVFTSTDGTIVRSATTAEHAFTIGKGTPSAPTWSVTKKVTAKKAGKLTVKVAKPSGLAQPTGKVTLTLKLGKKKVVIKNKALSSGKVTVTVPKQKAGKWKVTVTYGGDANYKSRTSASKVLTVKKK